MIACDDRGARFSLGLHLYCYPRTQWLSNEDGERRAGAYSVFSAVSRPISVGKGPLIAPLLRVFLRGVDHIISTHVACPVTKRTGRAPT
jgi:hypothetical protein